MLTVNQQLVAGLGIAAKESLACGHSDLSKGDEECGGQGKGQL